MVKKRKNRKKEKYKLIFFLLAFAFLGVILTQININFSKLPITEISLFDYDTKVFNNQTACFAYTINSEENYIQELDIEVNDIQFYKKEIDVEPGLKYSEIVCVPDTLLKYKNNKVRLIFGFHTLSFNVIKENATPLPTTKTAVETLKVLPEKVIFKITNGEAKGVSVLLSIYVDGKLDHNFRVELEPSQTKELSEGYSLKGSEVSISLAKPFETRSKISKNEDLITMFLASILIFILPGFLITSKFFNVKQYSGFISLTIAFSVILSTFFSWILSSFGLTSIIWLVLLIISLLLLFYPKKITFPKNPSTGNKILTIIAFFVFLTIASQLVLPSHNSMWSVYYERQVNSVYENYGLPQNDSLSYLGRPFTFFPGYMFFRSSYSWTTNIHPAETFFVFQILGTIFLVSSILFLGKKLGFNINSSVILVMFLLSSAFIFGWALISLLHLYGFALFLLAIAMVLDKKFNWFFPGILVGASAIFHALTIVGFPLILFAFMKKIDWKRIIYPTIIGGLLFMMVYSYFFITVGPPSEIQEENWGYLIKPGTQFFKGKFIEPIIDLGGSTAGFMSLAILPAFVYGFRSQRKLVLLTLILIFAFLFFSYRLNIFLLLIASVLFIKVFNSKQFLVLLILFSLTLFYDYQVYQGVISDPLQSPFMYIALNTKMDSKLLVEPVYGHTSNYITQRKSLADLYVEYADEEKYLDAINFIASWKNGGNTGILDKWGISYVVTEKKTRVLSIYERVKEKKEIVFSNLDNIYDNGYFNVHYYRTNNQ